MKRFFVLVAFAILVLGQLGCSPDEEQAQIENPAIVDVTDEFNAAPLVGEVTLESMYEDEVRRLATKTPVEVITAIEGTSKVIFEAEFRRVQPSGYGFPLYECVLTDEAITAMGGLAQGMSGSPVGIKGKVFGALSYGDYWAAAPHRFWVTPIDAMEATLEHVTFGEFLNPPGAPGAAINSTFTSIKTPVTITGVDANRLGQLSSHLQGTQYNNVEFYARIGGAPGAPPANASKNLTAGDMIGVFAATGDIVNIGGFGTVTQVYDDKFVAFGHDMFLGGQASMPTYRAVVDGIVPNTRIAYKSASAYGNPIGTITKDLRAGIVGELGKLPSMIDVNVAYHPVNSQLPIETKHKVAYGQEELAIPIVAATSLDAIRSEVSTGTLEAHVEISFKETDEVYTESFRSITPDPYETVLARMSRIIGSFTNILANGAGRATIDEVNIYIADLPYILHTEIKDIHVIGEVKQGEVATFVLETLPHWSAAGQSRNMYREVKLYIPENFQTGKASLSMAAATDYGFNPFGSPFAQSPENLDQLIGQLKDLQYDRGLVLATLATLEEEEPGLGMDSIEGLFEDFFEQFFEAIFEGIAGGGMPPGDGVMPPDDGETPGDGETPPDNGETPPDNGETPPDNGETPPENGEVIDIVDEEEMMEEMDPTPRPIPITGTALIINRFIVTGDTEIELEVLPADVEVDTETAEE